MLDTKSNWPFGLGKGYFPRFLAVSLLIFSGLLVIDEPVTRWVSSLPPIVDAIFQYVTKIGSAGWIVVPTLLGMLFVRIAINSQRFAQFAGRLQMVGHVSKFIFFVTVVPGLFANLLKRLIGRARPIHLDEYGLFSFKPVLNDWSFQAIPSGHTTVIFAFSMGVIFLRPKWRWFMLGFALLGGISRIMVGAHFPTDVFAGILTGIIAAYAVRNYWLHRGWIFFRNEQGEIVHDLKWKN